MKNKIQIFPFSILAIALMVVMSISSCSKDNTVDPVPTDTTDMSAVSVDTPATLQSLTGGQKLTPTATFKNLGTKADSFSVLRFEIVATKSGSKIYTDSVAAGIVSSGATVQKSFKQWPVLVGTDSMQYTFRAIAQRVGDQKRSNDTASMTTADYSTSPFVTLGFKATDYYLSSFYKTDANENKLDSTKSKHSSIVLSTTLTLGSETNAVMIVDSSFNPDGSFYSPLDTTYLKQQSNKDIWAYGFMKSLAKKINSQVTLNIPAKWTNFAALSKGIGAVYVAEIDTTTTTIGGQQTTVILIDSVTIVSVDTTVMEGTTRIQKSVRVLHTVFVDARTSTGNLMLNGHLPFAFWFSGAPRGIVKKQAYRHNFTGLASQQVPQTNSVTLLEKATLH